MNAGTPSRSASRDGRLLPALAAGLALAMCCAGLALASPALAAPGAGPGWQAQPLPAGVSGVTGIACPSASSCVAVGSAEQTGTAGLPVILLTTDGGGRWAEAGGLPAGLASLSGVACASVSRCWVAGSWKGAPYPAAAVLATSDGGLHWARQALPAGLRSLAGIDCPAQARCWAAGQASAGGAAVVATDDGGATWARQALPGGIAALSAVSCGTTTRCWAAGSSAAGTGVAAGTTNAGRTWTRTDVTGTLALDGISCVGDDHCRASGLASIRPGTAAVVATDDGGLSWASQALPPGLARLWAVTCPSDRDCQAVGETTQGDGAAIRTADGGVSWVTEPLPAPVQVLVLQGVACAGTADCWAAGTAASHRGVVLHRAA